jgi:hypothetical protein
MTNMKKMTSVILLAFLSLIYFSSCQPKVDTEKEKEAIKVVFEKEKAAFFNQDLTGMGETWVNEPTSVKIYISGKDQTKFEGWDKINAQSQKEISDTSFDRKQIKVSILNYQIDVMDKSAWVLCDYHWEGNIRGEAMTMNQSRICVLKKVDNKWKFALMAMYANPQK